MTEKFYFVNKRTNEVTADDNIFFMWNLCGDAVDMYYGEPSEINNHPMSEFC